MKRFFLALAFLVGISHSTFADNTGSTVSLPTGNYSVTTGGGVSVDMSGANVGTVGKTSSRLLSARFAEAINVLDYGAIGDGSSHPISGLTTFNGQTVTGWTLAQWQAVYPFVTALTNETDDVAIVAAERAALTANRALHIPAGIYRVNFSASLSPTVTQLVTIYGDGQNVTQIAVNGAVTFLTFNLPSYTGTTPDTTLLFKDMSIYQTDTSAIEGTAIAVLGTAASQDQPSADFVGMQFGAAVPPTVGTGSAFAVSVNLLNTGFSHFERDRFNGNVWYSHTGGGANGRNGIGVQMNGTSGTNLGFGPYFDDCTWGAQDIAVLIGDGTHAYVQGVKLIGGSAVGVNTVVKWHSAAKSEGSDYLLVSDMDLQAYTTAIDVDTVATVHLIGDYFLGGNNVTMVHLQNNGGQAPEWQITGNTFEAYANAANGVLIDNPTASVQTSIDISANKFFDFGAAGEAPITLGTNTTLVSVATNTISDSNAPVDNGSNNSWSNNTVVNSASGNNATYASGLPVLAANLYNDSTASSSQAAVINRVPVADQAKAVSVITDGGSQTAANGVSWQVYTPAAVLSTFTTTLPANPVDGQTVTFSSTQLIREWTINANAGQLLNMNTSQPIPLRPNQLVTFRWSKTNITWQLASIGVLPTGMLLPPNAFVYNSTSTLSSGNRIILFNGASPSTLTLPAISNYASGDGIIFYNAGSVGFTIIPTSGDNLYPGTFTVRPNESTYIVNNGGTWFPLFGAETKFGVPTVTACTGGSVSGHDNSMTVTFGSSGATSCGINWSVNGAWGGLTPHCTFSPANAAATQAASVGAYLSLPSGSGFTMTGTALANTSFNILCQ